MCVTRQKKQEGDQEDRFLVFGTIISASERFALLPGKCRVSFVCLSLLAHCKQDGAKSLP